MYFEPRSNTVLRKCPILNDDLHISKGNEENIKTAWFGNMVRMKTIDKTNDYGEQDLSEETEWINPVKYEPILQK